MPLLITLFLLVPLVCAVADIGRKRFEEAAPLVLLGLALALIVLGVFSLLSAALWLFYLLWGMCVLYTVFALVRFLKKKQWPPWCSVGAMAFLAGACLLWWVCRGHRYANWDEFTHWGRAAKAVFTQNVLPALADIRTNFREYPPGVAPLQALVLQAGRMPFREDVVIFVQGLFSLALLLYPLRRFDGKNKTGAAVTALLLFCAPLTVYWNFYGETTVDGLLGVLFGFVLLVQFLGDGGTYDRVLQCLACAMLPLVKASGLLLAALACAVMLADEIRCARARKQSLKNPLFWLWRLLPLGSALLAAGAWNGVIAAYDIPRRWTPEGLSISAIWQLVSQGQPAWRAETAKSYFANIFADFNYGWPVGFLPFMGFFLVFAGLFWLLWRFTSPKAMKERFKTAFWGLFAAGILYTLLVLCNYLFFFSEYEAVRLASLSRYLNTYLVAMLVLLCGWLAVVLPGKKLPVQLAAGMAGAGLWAVLGNAGVIMPLLVKAPEQAVWTSAIQNQYTEVADAIRAVTDDAVPRVYVIAQDDIGATIPRLEYELSPGYLPTHTTSIAPDVPEGELLSQQLSPQEWAALLLQDGYEYVYLFRVDEAFAAAYGGLFPGDEWITNGRMFHVVPAGDGVVLQPVQAQADGIKVDVGT